MRLYRWAGLPYFAAAAACAYRETQEQLHEETREIRRRTASFYSLPLSEMAGLHKAAVVDYAGDYQIRTGPRDEHGEYQAYLRAREDFKSRGITLSENGFIRVGSYLGILAEGRGIAVTPEAWLQALERLFELSCFAVGEISGYRPPVKQTQAVKQPTPDSIENLSTEHREQRQEILKIVGKEWGQEVASMFFDWVESLRKNWNYEFPVEKLAQKVGEYMVAKNLNPLRHKSYDDVRVAFGKLGYMPLFMTEREKLADLIEGSNLDDRSVRQNINQRHREILESEPAFNPHK